MARRNDHTHEEIRNLALESLLEHLQQQPLGNMSLRKLAQRIGYSAATLINVFGSYDQLLLSLNAITLDQLSDLLKAENSDSAQQRLLSFARNYLHFAEQNCFQWQLLFEHRLPDGEDVPVWQQQRIDDLFEFIEQALTQLAPTASQEALQLASRTIWASVHGICTLSLGDKLFAEKSINAASMIESLIHSYTGAWALQFQ